MDGRREQISNAWFTYGHDKIKLSENGHGKRAHVAIDPLRIKLIRAHTWWFGPLRLRESMNVGALQFVMRLRALFQPMTRVQKVAIAPCGVAMLRSERQGERIIHGNPTISHSSLDLTYRKAKRAKVYKITCSTVSMTTALGEREKRAVSNDAGCAFRVKMCARAIGIDAGLRQRCCGYFDLTGHSQRCRHTIGEIVTAHFTHQLGNIGRKRQGTTPLAQHVRCIGASRNTQREQHRKHVSRKRRLIDAHNYQRPGTRERNCASASQSDRMRCSWRREVHH